MRKGKSRNVISDDALGLTAEGSQLDLILVGRERTGSDRDQPPILLNGKDTKLAH